MIYDEKYEINIKKLCKYIKKLRRRKEYSCLKQYKICTCIILNLCEKIPIIGPISKRGASICDVHTSGLCYTYHYSMNILKSINISQNNLYYDEKQFYTRVIDKIIYMLRKEYETESCS